MTLQELRYFCVTAEVLHYTRAASLLYISQPSLSYALGKLEKELGIPLFEKHGKKVALTKYGKELLPYAKRALSELQDGIDHLQQMQQPAAGIISLGYIYSVSFALLPTFVDRFYTYQGSDKTAFRFHQGTAGELIERLLTGTLDLLIAGRTDIASIDCLPLYRQELFLTVPASHRLADASAVSLNDISDENFVSITHDAGIYRQLETQFKRAAIRPKTVFEADEYSSIAASVTTGAGVAIMPRLPILNNFNIKLIPFEDPGISIEVCLLRCDSHEMTPAVRSVWDYAKTYARSFTDN